MVTLPIFLSQVKELVLMQTKWASILNVLINNPSLNSNIINNVSLVSGKNVINHLLGRNLVGYRIIGKNAVADIYDEQASNQSPNLTLVLRSNASCMINLEVF